MKPTLWIVGGSSGIGFELAALYLKNNYQVIVSARKAIGSTSLQALSAQYPETLKLVDTDVSDTQSVLEATEKAWQSFGGIDTCFYNAGVYAPMKVKAWDIAKFEQMTQINYLGAVRVTTALTPFFQKSGKGSFVFNASISSYFGLPYGGGYSAPKAALMNFCEAIKPELETENIDVRIINYGFVKTRLTAKNEFEMPQLLEPSEAAKIIYEKLNASNRFEIRFPFLLTSFLYFLRCAPRRIAFYFTSKTL